MSTSVLPSDAEYVEHTDFTRVDLVTLIRGDRIYRVNRLR